MRRFVLCRVVVVLVAVGNAPDLMGAIWGEVSVDGLDPQLLIEGEDLDDWQWMPDFIRGSDIHSLNVGQPSRSPRGRCLPKCVGNVVQ